MNATATIVSARPQQMRALERANQARRARAELKRRVAQGEIEVAEVILTGPWAAAERMAVADLLSSQRHWGHARVRKFLASVAISENKTIGSMTERQRRAVAARLTMHG
jgi:glutathione S-transferase